MTVCFHCVNARVIAEGADNMDRRNAAWADIEKYTNVVARRDQVVVEEVVNKRVPVLYHLNSIQCYQCFKIMCMQCLLFCTCSYEY